MPKTNNPNARPAQYDNRHHSKLEAQPLIATGNILGKRIVEVVSSCEGTWAILSHSPKDALIFPVDGVSPCQAPSTVLNNKPRGPVLPFGAQC